MSNLAELFQTAVEFDLHPYHPHDVKLLDVVRQAWEMGAQVLVLIHGHGFNRSGIPRVRANTNTGYMGLTVRSALRNDKELRQWLYHTTIDVGDSGVTTIKLKPNVAPSRTAFDIQWNRSFASRRAS